MKTNATTWCLFLGILWAPAAMAGPPVCWADVTGDGVVGSADLQYLLAAWGTENETVDFDGDGEVACFDLEFLTGNWGRCRDKDVNGDGSTSMLDLLFVEANIGLDCSADLNLDGDIDEEDVDAFLCVFGSSGPVGDLDGNGFVQVADLTILLSTFGAACQCDLDQDGEVGYRDVEVFTPEDISK